MNLLQALYRIEEHCEDDIIIELQTFYGETLAVATNLDETVRKFDDYLDDTVQSVSYSDIITIVLQ